MSIINGSSGSDIIVDNATANQINGLAGLDNINAGGGNDTLYGGTDDDVLQGGEGADTYLFNRGDGMDTINNYQTTAAADKIVLGAGISAANIKLYRQGNDLLITFTNSPNDIILIQNQFLSADYRLNTVQFNDGSTLSISPLTLTNRLYSSDRVGASVSQGYDGVDIISGKSGRDYIYGNGGNDSLSGGGGDDYIDGGSGNNILIGGKGDDNISAGMGSDIFRFNVGDGNDVLYNLNVANMIHDKIVFGAGITSADLIMTLVGYTDDSHQGNDLVIHFKNSPNDSIRIWNQYTSDTVYNDTCSIDTIQFSDGSIMSLKYINLGKDLDFTEDYNDMTLEGDAAPNVLQGKNGNDTLYGDDGNDTLDGGGGYDALYGGMGHNRLLGGSGNDYLYGGQGDTLIGGTGNDQLVGGSGADTYVFNFGDGQDTIVYANVSQSNDKIILGSGFTASHVRLNHDGQDLVISFTNSPDDSIRIQNQFESTLQFSDGSTLLITPQVLTNIYYLSGGIGADVLKGTDDREVITGNDGSDSLYGNGGNDTLSGGAGADFLGGGAGDDRLDGGLSADYMSGGGGNDTYVVDNALDNVDEGASAGTDTVISSVSVKLTANVENLTLTGTGTRNGVGNDLANYIVGNFGNNTLTGGKGSDTYNLGRTSQHDTLIESDSTVGNKDTLRFAADVHYDQLWFKRIGNDLEVDIIGTANAATVKNFFYSSANHIEVFRSGDGKVLTDTHVQNLVSAMAGMAQPAAGQTVLTAAQQTQLAPVFAANWT